MPKRFWHNAMNFGQGNGQCHVRANTTITGWIGRRTHNDRFLRQHLAEIFLWVCSLVKPDWAEDISQEKEKFTTTAKTGTGTCSKFSKSFPMESKQIRTLLRRTNFARRCFSSYCAEIMSLNAAEMQQRWIDCYNYKTYFMSLFYRLSFCETE